MNTFEQSINMSLISDAVASSYANERSKQLEFAFELSQVKKHVKKSNKILDLMCGPGDFLIYLKQRGYNIKGIDFSDEMICEAKTKAKRDNVNISVEKQDATQLTFPDSAFDFVLNLGDSMGTIPKESHRTAVLDETERILGKKGTTIITYGSVLSSLKLYILIFLEYIRNRKKGILLGDKYYSLHGNSAIHHYYFPFQMKKELKNRSFRIITDIRIPKSDKRMVIAQKK